MDGKSFSAGKLTLDKNVSVKSAGASHLDHAGMCSQADDDTGDQTNQSTADRGTGSVAITAAGPTVKGTFDITFKAGRVTGAFDAKACPNKRTMGFMHCPGGT